MTNDFLSLVRLGIGNDIIEPPLSEKIDWSKIEALAKQHGLLGVLVDGVNRLPQNIRPPQTTWLRWIGEVMQGYESQYVLYRKAVNELAAFYHLHGYRMMLLKGLACGMNWPKPEHRPYGDIDIYLFGRYKEADAALSRELGIKIDNSHHHHTVFQWQGFTVENHYDFINVNALKFNEELERVFKSLANDSTCSVDLLNQKVYLPTANFHALFLVRHLVAHFSSERLTIRQLLDWSFFVKNHGSEIDWSWLDGMLEQFGMIRFYRIINTICVEDLGFGNALFSHAALDTASQGIAGQARNEDVLKKRVLNDIISPEFLGNEPKHIWKRVPFKYRRWKSNGWKRELCFNESPGSAFWCGIKSQIMKPASI